MSTPHSGSDEQVQREIERTKREAAHLASDAAESAKERGRDTLDHAKERTAGKAEELASALESTASDFDSRDGSDALAGYGRSMAEMLRRFAGGLREQDIDEFAGQLAGFARRNPASFLAGSVALGFGFSRFLKASSTRPHDDYELGYDDEDEYLLESDEEDRSDWDYAASSGSDTWPEDGGIERPGAGSSSEHWSPIVSGDPMSGAAGTRSVAEPASRRTELGASGEERRNET